MSYDLPHLVSCLCCISKYQQIFDVMKTLNNDELIQLRDDLRKHHGKNLNQFIEMEFKNRMKP